MTKKPELAVVCKTYHKDAKQFERMLKSFRRYNTTGIPLFVSVPEADKGMFEKIVDNGAKVVTDESYAGKYITTDKLWGLSPGYVNQEICKLSFWESNAAHNYLFVDSDVVFIRNFEQSDFMYDKLTPYSVLTMDKDLHTEHFYRDFGAWRQERIRDIFKAVGLEDKRMLTCHGMTVLSEIVLKDFKRSFMTPNGYEYVDLIRISPYEFSWYNAWLQKSNLIKVLNVEPFFKTFHMRIEYNFSRLRLISQADIATQYVGLVLNSNWKPKAPPSQYADPGLFARVINRGIERLL